MTKRFGYIGEYDGASGIRSFRENDVVEVDVYLSAGGGRGGCCDWGGGGGAGGCVDSTGNSGKPLLLKKGVAYTVTIGAANSGDSYFGTNNDIFADGGGAGVSKYASGQAGGSGGGAGADTNGVTGGAALQTDQEIALHTVGNLRFAELNDKTSAAGFGNAGGGGNHGGNHSNGGGGAGGAGGASPGGGRSVAWDGSSNSYSGGGGAAGRFYGPTGGQAGGGYGGNYGGSPGNAGANRGSGGGGSGYSGHQFNASGGSGIAYVRTKATISATGANATGSSGGYNYARWTGSGSVTFG